MGVNNGNKILLQLESTSKKLSNRVLKVKIEHSYEAVVICKVGLNPPSGSHMKDLSKKPQKIDFR